MSDPEKIAELFEQKYRKRMDKKMEGKPPATRIIMSRTFDTAIMVYQNIYDMPFEKLTSNIYFLCKDLQFREIVRLYDAQLELAGVDPEKFIFGLHSFYNNVTSRVKKEGKLLEFAEYVGMVTRLHNEQVGLDENVVNAYLNLILQTFEYLRIDKFNLNTFAYGVSTNGELLMGPYPLAYSDLPVIELKRMIKNGKVGRSRNELERLVYSLFAKYGITVNSISDIELMNATQRIHSVTASALFPFINEFTFDIIPDSFYEATYVPFLNFNYRISIDIEALKASLQHRNRTLPTNGTIFEIDDTSGELHGALMKEIVYQDRIIMLYRLDTRSGSLAGYFDTKGGFFFSAVQGMTIETFYHNLMSFILALYASQVLDNVPESILSEAFAQKDTPITVKAYRKGGKLQNQYNPQRNSSDSGVKRNPDNFNKEERYINAIIRKLPEGKLASDEAKQLAEQYGYVLAPGETFVRPFTKQVFVKKETKEQSSQ